MKKILLIVALLLIGSPCFAITRYIAQTAQGTEDGSSCANADDVAWYNANAADGDLIYLCNNGNIDGLVVPDNNITHEVAAGESVTFDSGASGYAIYIYQVDDTVFKKGSGTAFNLTGDASTTVMIDGTTGDYASGTVFDGFTLDDVGGSTGYPDGVYADGFKLRCADTALL